MTDLTFTLGDIRRHMPCIPGWERLLIGIGVGASYDPGMRVSLGDIAMTNNADDALWCVRCLDWSDVEVSRAVISGVLLPAVKRAAAYTADQRVHDCTAVLERWCGGDDSVDLLAAADAAWAAARAARAAWAAARAAWAAARAAWAAARAAEAAKAAKAAKAAEAAEAAEAAARAAAAAEAAADDAWDTEPEQQRRDIIAAFPPLVVKEG